MNTRGEENNVAVHTEEYTSLSICSGIGGLDTGTGEAIRIVPLCYVEIGAENAEILVSLMEQGEIGEAPIFSDLTRFPTEIFRDRVDILQGGFPCQPFSQAGLQKGVADERNLWPSVARIIRGVRPTVVFLENVPGIKPYYFSTIRPELCALGYVVNEGLFSAEVDGGAPQTRQRLFILAYSEGTRLQRRGIQRYLADHDSELDDSEHNGLAGPEEPRGVGLRTRHGAAGEVKPEQPTRSGGGTGGDNELAHAEDSRHGLRCRESGRENARSGSQGSSDRGNQESESGGQELAHAEDSDARQPDPEGVCRGEPEDEAGSRGSTGRRQPGTLADCDTGLCLHEEKEVCTGGEPSQSGSSEGELAHSSDDGLTRRAIREVGNEAQEEGRGRNQPSPPIEDCCTELAHADHGGSNEPGREPGWFLPLFPPGPNDTDGWRWVLERFPELGPTYCKEGHLQSEMQTAESQLLRMVDGASTGNDIRLRAIGNAVCPITAAIAFVTLGRGRIF